MPGLGPQMIRPRIETQTCSWCGSLLGSDEFAYTNSPFYPKKRLPMCNSCIKQYLTEKDFQWDAIDRICQCADIPFVPREFERVHNEKGDDCFPIYAALFATSEYEGLGWDNYYKAYKQLRDNGQLIDELPLLAEDKRAKLIDRWGANYDDEALMYLEQLYQGLQATQNIAGALQSDQAYKICKISYEIDCRIREGVDFDKLLGSYDKLVKTAEFTPKNAKNAADFDTTGELIKFLEKKGWRCKYYDDVTRDIVDETIKNIQAYNQRLYTNESGLGEEITRRIEALERAKKLEGAEQSFEERYYGESADVSDNEADLYETEGYKELLSMDGDDFEAEVDGYDS